MGSLLYIQVRRFSDIAGLLRIVSTVQPNQPKDVGYARTSTSAGEGIADGLRSVELLHQFLRRPRVVRALLGVAQVPQRIGRPVETPVRQQRQPGPRTEGVQIEERPAGLEIPELQPARGSRGDEIASGWGECDGREGAQMPVEGAKELA